MKQRGGREEKEGERREKRVRYRVQEGLFAFFGGLCGEVDLLLSMLRNITIVDFLEEMKMKRRMDR